MSAEPTGPNPAASTPAGAPAASDPGPSHAPASPRPGGPSPNGKAPLIGRKPKIRARKVHRVLRHVEPWSVLKISLLFYLCLFLILLVASVVLWSVGRSTGAVDNVESFITELGFGNCTPPDEVPAGTEFTVDEDCPEDWVVVGAFSFEDTQLLQGAAVGGLVLVVAGAAANTLLAVLFNLISDLTGGVRVTVLEEQVRRRQPAEPSPSAPPE